MDSHLLLPLLVDETAEQHPEMLWAEYPKISEHSGLGFAPITYLQLRNAAHPASHCLEAAIGNRNQVDHRTLAYIGPNDARYQILLLAAMRVGLKIFFPSPRNSISAQLQLLDQVGCTLLLSPDPRPPSVTALLRQRSLCTVQIPPLDALLSANFCPFPYSQDYTTSSNENVLILHTSGTTGLPTPLTYTNKFLAQTALLSKLEPPTGSSSIYALMHGKRIISFLPSFHVSVSSPCKCNCDSLPFAYIAGIYISTINAIVHRSPVVFPSPESIPTAESLIEILKHTKADIAFLSPVTLEEISKSETLMNFISDRLSLLLFSGAPISSSAAERLNMHITTLPCYGSSEFGAWPLLRLHEGQLHARDSQYMRLHPLIGARFRHRTDDLFELVLPMQSGHRDLQPVFNHFPTMRAYHTKDLFSPHPTLVDYWIYRGRYDDIIVFANGEKMNPTDFEGTVSTHPAIKACLVVGSGKSEAALLVELADSADKNHIGVSEIWPTIQFANRNCPKYAEVARERVLITKRPFAWAGKGTVQRSKTLQTFATEIEDLYSSVQMKKIITQENLSGNSRIDEERFRGSPVRSIDSDLDGHEKSLRFHHGNIDHKTIVNMSEEIGEFDELDTRENFFTKGLDSQQVMRIVREIKNRLGCDITPKSIYGSGSVEALAEIIQHNTPEV